MRQLLLGALSLFLITASSARAEDAWPDLSKPARAIGGGEHDAAVVVGVENYFAVPGVPGAKSNAGEWYDYLTETRGIPPQNVKLLTNADATREEILGASRKAAGQAGAKGTLWFVFIGHGAPSADGKDGLLVGVDAQQKSESLQTRSVRRGELLKALAAGPAGSIRVVLDACFSGRGQDGATIAPGLQPLVTVAAIGALDPRMAVLTAAKGDQFAGSLPGADRPAFSYLVLGGLRGWAAGVDGKVTAGSLWSYTKNALAATLRGRDQTPDLLGPEGAAMGASAGEKGPNLAGLAKTTAGGGFQVTNLAPVPRAQAPKALDSDPAGLDFRNLDIEALKKKSATVKLDKSGASAEEKAEGWRQLAKAVPQFADKAAERATEWDRFAAEKKTVEDAKQKRLEARDSDWSKLSELLALEEAVVPQASKASWSREFLRAYFKSPGIEPAMAKELAPYALAVAMKAALTKLAESAPVDAPSKTARGKAGIQWVSIPGGTFEMGKGAGRYPQGEPVHQVALKAFEMAKSPVTFKQYKACVDSGVCSAPHVSDGACYSYDGGNGSAGNLPPAFQGDNQPVVCVDWQQAKVFSEWAGGSLPSEAQWEYAARSAGKDYDFPWGNADATCERAVLARSSDGGPGCGRKSTWPVCSKPKGNTEQGLCDMAGNVRTWLQDYYQSGYEGAPEDGGARESPESVMRSVRGTDWTDIGSITSKAWFRSASEAGNSYHPGARTNNMGLRPVRSSP